MTKEDIRTFVAAQVVQQGAINGQYVSIADLGDDCDLLLSGLIDSLGLLELTAALDDYCGLDLDFESLEPERMTIVGPLCEFVASEVASQRS